MPSIGSMITSVFGAAQHLHSVAKLEGGKNMVNKCFGWWQNVWVAKCPLAKCLGGGYVRVAQYWVAQCLMHSVWWQNVQCLNVGEAHFYNPQAYNYPNIQPLHFLQPMSFETGTFLCVLEQNIQESKS